MAQDTNEDSRKCGVNVYVYVIYFSEHVRNQLFHTYGQLTSVLKFNISWLDKINVDISTLEDTASLIFISPYFSTNWVFQPVSK